jgi:hypothetical protein
MLGGSQVSLGMMEASTARRAAEVGRTLFYDDAQGANEALRQDFGHGFAGTLYTRTELYALIAIILGPPAKPELLAIRVGL